MKYKASHIDVVSETKKSARAAFMGCITVSEKTDLNAYMARHMAYSALNVYMQAKAIFHLESGFFF